MPYFFTRTPARLALMLVVFYMLPAASLAQQTDSLEKEIRNKNLTDIERIDALNILSRDLTFVNPIRSARLASEALQLSLKINYPAGQAHGYRILASVFSTNNNIIIATEYMQKSLKIFERTGDSAGIANCYITKAHIFRRSKNRAEELEHNKKAFEIFSRLKIPSRIGVAANNLGESYLLVNDYQKSRELTQYAIHLNDSLHNLSVLSNCYKVMGKLDMVAGNTAAAEQAFKTSLAISAKLGDNSQKIATMESLIELSDVYKKTRQPKLQLYYLETAAAFAKENLLEDYLKKIYGELISMHSAQHEKVLQHVIEYRDVSDHISAHLLQTKIELNKYGSEIYDFVENENLKLERELIVQEHKIKTKNFFLLVSLVSGLLFAIMAFVLLKLLRKQKKAEAEIKNKTEELRELAAHLQNIREQERTAVASEIHEELGQQLTVIKMDVSWLRERLSKTDETAAIKRADDINDIIDNTIKSVRRISTSLRPGVLDDIGLTVAIKWQLKEFEKKYLVKTRFEEVDDNISLPGSVETGLFRIFQEALTNIGQHHKAQHVSVKLYRDEKEVILEIEDDGSGFSSTDSNTKENLNFLEMKERCYMINGNFDICSTKGKGSTITVRIPAE